MSGERNLHTGDPTDSLVGWVAAILAGTGNPDKDHPAWLSMSQAERESWYVKAERVIDIIRRSDV